MKNNYNNTKTRIAVLQRICPSYRVAIFEQLSANEKVNFQLFIGEDIPESKVKSSKDLEFKHLQYKKLNTKFIKIWNRVLPWHKGLINELRKFNPDVILCEGESHFLGYLQAIFYKLYYNKKVRLIHWCFISLPGELNRINSISFRIKSYFRQYFNAFLVYSSYSKNQLIKLGESEEKIFVATNVGDVQTFLKMSDELTDSKSGARIKLNIPEKFTILYSGTLDTNKRPEILIDLATVCDREKFNFVLIGTGPLLNNLKERVLNEKLSNVFITGRIEENLSLYYRAADVLLIPGRGGIVMSEAMAFGIPVAVYQADGTEYDLIIDKGTGLYITSDTLSDFKRGMEFLQENQQKCTEMGIQGRRLIENKFNTQNMITNIINAANYSK